jgi:hypothetical protein
MTCLGFEPTIPAFERAETIHASDRSATVIANSKFKVSNYKTLNLNWYENCSELSASMNSI